MPKDINADEENTYFIYRTDGVELARLIHQTQLVLKLHGELLPDQLPLTTPRHILDVACGPGGWTIEAARAYPDSHVVGFDINPIMIEHAKMFAEAEVVPNVSFMVMNAMKPLDFPDDSFDLVNANYLYTFMPPSAWPAFLQECKRVLRPDGVVKLGELEVGITSGPATEELYLIFAQMMFQAERSFSCDGRHHGTTAALKPLLRDTGYTKIGHKAYAFECSYGTPGHQPFLEDLITICRHMQPGAVHFFARREVVNYKEKTREEREHESEEEQTAA